MKYIFFSCLSIFLCTCVHAQTFSIEYSPTNADTARWKVSETLNNGSEQTYTEPYDSIQKVIEFGTELYRQGGFIGSYRIELPSALYEALADVIATDGGETPDQQQLREILLPLSPADIEDIGHSQGESDVDYEGRFAVSGDNCAITDAEILMYEDVVSLKLGASSHGAWDISVINRDIISVYDSCEIPIPLIRVNESPLTWATKGCVFTYTGPI